MAVDRLARKGAVEIDDVEILEALGLENRCLGRRIVVEHRGLVHFAKLKAHTLAVFKVDCREEDQIRSRSVLDVPSPHSPWLGMGRGLG